MLRSLSRLTLLPLSLLFLAGCGDTDTTEGAPDDAIAGADTSGADSAPVDADTTDTEVSDSAISDSETSIGDAVADSKAGDTATLDGATDAATDSGTKDASSTRKGPAPVLLGLAGNYVMLGQSEVRTVSTSIVTGDLGISPATSTGIVGFGLTRAGTFWTSAMVTGKVYSVDNDAPTPSLLTTAVANMMTAYTDAAGRPTPDALNLAGGAIGGSTLVPGLYKWTTSVGIGSDVTFAGGAEDTWILQITGDLTEATSKHVKLSGGAKAKNIVWQVSGLVALAATTHFEGIILCKTGITLQTGATINGRLLAQTAVIIDSSTVTQPSL